MRRRKVLKFTGIGLGVLLIFYVVFSAFGARDAMRIPRLPVVGSPESVGLEYQDVSFMSRGDNVTLRGWFLPGTKDQVIMIVHGGFQPRVDEVVDTLGLTRALVDKGYNVLIYDERGRGESDGKGLALSHIDADVGGAFDYLLSRGYSTDEICIMGFCSGAAQACIFAAQNDIRALILDGCFLNVPTEVVRQAAEQGIPQFLARAFVPGLEVMTRLIYHYHLVNPIDVVGEVKCPIFFIHEQNDFFTTWEETNRFYRASDNPANRIWEISNTLHSEGFRTHPTQYVDKVDAFVAAVLGH
jgi:pimeloyl-ACP methyl ester carboxylesterase